MTSTQTPSHQRSRYAFQWELPEVFAAAITLAVGLMIIGGVVAVLIIVVGTHVDFRHRLGGGLFQGLFWVNPALAAVLLLALVLAWWQVRAWTDAQNSQTYSHAEVEARVTRSHAIVRWNMALFAALLVATVLYFVGLLLYSGFSGLTPVEEGDYVVFGLQSVGVLVMTLAGFIGARNVLALSVQPVGSSGSPLPSEPEEDPLGQ